MKKKVIIYGGAFNPPTIAHKLIVETCLAEAERIGAEVWLMPSGPRPDKQISTDMGLRHRLINAFIEDIGHPLLGIEWFELEQQGLTETHITHKHLSDTYPDREFIWVFGADSIQTMRSWGKGEMLWEELSMLVLNRPGYEIHDLPPKATLHQVDTPPVSSTEVRSAIANNQPFGHLVPEKVYRELINL